MEQSFTNDNMRSGNNKTIEICMNDVVLEDKYEEIKTQVSKQKQVVIQKDDNEKIMKGNLKKLHVRKKSWKPHGKTYFCLSFHCVNDNVKVDLENTQIMHLCCILCYRNLVIGINPRI
jgi:membrane-associated HD superfamily phosphohydrolase